MKTREILRKYYAKQSEEKSRKIKQMLKMLNFQALKPGSLMDILNLLLVLSY